MKRRKYDKQKVMLVALIMIFLGVALLSYNYIKEKKEKAFENMNFAIFTEINLEEIPENVDNKEDIKNDDKSDKNDKISKTPSYSYIGILEIPKINLKKGFLLKESKDNTIEKNVMILPSSDYPDVDKGNIILAAHSGTSYKSFFNNLSKLKQNDLAYIYYKNIKYIYKIVKIYKQARTGKVAIYRDYEKSCLTLITCTLTDNETQTIYISELIEKQNY